MNAIRPTANPPSSSALRRAAVLVALALAWVAGGERLVAAEPTLPGDVDGVVVAGYDATLAFPIGGVLAEVAVSPGEPVAAGATLARLEDAEARAAAERARLAAESDAAVRLAEQRLELARQDHAASPEGDDDAAKVNRQRTATRVRIAELELERQKLLYQQAQREHDLAAARLRRHTLTAPVDAIVEHVGASPGSFVATGQPIVRLVQPRTLLVQAAVPSDRTTGLSVGDSVRVHRRRVARDGEASPPLPGRIVFVAATLDPKTDSRLVRIALDDPADLLPGALVGLDLQPPDATDAATDASPKPEAEPASSSDEP